jgi:tetratricopeptide (TPR) repeat protein
MNRMIHSVHRTLKPRGRNGRYSAEKAYADPVVKAQISNVTCWAAITYEKAGHPAKADAALTAIGAIDHPDCFRLKADLLDLRGDWAGASIWYEKSIKRAVLYPASYYSWGLALAKHKDLKGAAEQFQLAHAKGPHWADPLKAWGDVLVLQGKTSEALAKYDEALNYATNWKQLKEAREVTAKQKG